MANEPTADMLYTWTTILTVMTACFTMLAFQLAIKCYTQREQKTGDDETSSDIELDEIRVHHLSGSSMHGMDADSYVKTPGVDVEITKHDADCPPVPSPGASSIADPPPIYSLDGARR